MGSVRIGRTEIVSLINKAITLAHEQNGKTNAAWIALMILLHQRFRSSPSWGLLNQALLHRATGNRNLRIRFT